MRARKALRRVVADPSADPVEVALRVQGFHERDLDVATALLRVEAIADVVRTASAGAHDPPGRPGSPALAAERLQLVLGDRLGYRGDPDRDRVHQDAYLARTLDEHHGLPVTLAALYVGVARRLRVPAYVVNLPGHVVAAIGDGDRPVVVDAFAGGRVLREADLTALLDAATGGRVPFTRALLRPAPAVDLARRFLHNLTADLRREGPPDAAIWTVVARLALPDPDPHDHRLLGDLLVQSGRFLRGAQAYDRYLEAAPDGPEAGEVTNLARAARARTN